MSGYVNALRETVHRSLAKLYAGADLPNEKQLEGAKRDGIAAIREVKANMPLQKRIAQARRNAAELGTRKYQRT